MKKCKCKCTGKISLKTQEHREIPSKEFAQWQGSWEWLENHSYEFLPNNDLHAINITEDVFKTGEKDTEQR